MRIYFSCTEGKLHITVEIDYRIIVALISLLCQ